MNELIRKEGPSSERTAWIIYILYLAGLVIGITHIIAVVMAYVYRSDAPAWLQSHFEFQIRTFWIGLLLAFVGLLLLRIKIGLLLLVLLLPWFIIRCIKGLKLLDEKNPHPDPKTWMF